MSKMMAYYTGLTCYQIVEEFEREIRPEDQAEFYMWVDKRFDNLWTIEREIFYRACDEFMVSNHGHVDQEAFGYARARYYKTMIDKLPEFRKWKGLDESKDFINSFIKQGDSE